ncbi:MAG: c-type cytochrome [Candidatus Kapabacteria bacterium]|nr:c-type cytochrome [Candidatus Kapabacteria bacterium]
MRGRQLTLHHDGGRCSVRMSRTIFAFVLAATLAAAMVRQEYPVSDDGIPQPPGFPAPVYRITSGTNNAALAALGERLFEDPILSADSTISCETCHQPFAAFAHVDHALSHGVEGRIGRRNVPSLQNLAWQTSFMWDGAIANLDMQSLSPITGHDEMASNLDTLIHKLSTNAAYPRLFREAFGTDTITVPRVLRAVGRFVAGFVSANARYDRYIAGKDTLAENELRGLQLFRAHCASCHAEPLFTNNGFASNGLRPNAALPDSGRYLVTHNQQDLFRFRVPTLRNITRTHPYMHDGRFKKLRDVLAHYASPQALDGHADASVRSIGPLSDVDRKDIIAFLMTLEDQ